MHDQGYIFGLLNPRSTSPLQLIILCTGVHVLQTRSHGGCTLKIIIHCMLRQKWGRPLTLVLHVILFLFYFSFKRAMELRAIGDHQECINAVNKAMGLIPDVPKYYVQRAESYIQLCDFKSAILNYKKACLLEPNNEGYYSRLSFLYYFEGQTLFDQRLYPEALECFSSAAEMNPDNVGYHIRR